MLKQASSSTHLPDIHQSVWQLSAIQLSGWTSLPILATSVLILQENSFLGAILTIVVGNALLWFIRLGIILMSHKKRQSTLDISRHYLGNVGSYCIGALLLISTLAWFITQTTSASNTLTHLIAIKESPDIDQFVQMSVLLGTVSTFLCMGGIVALRRVTTYVFPLLILAFVVAMWVSPSLIPKQGEAILSLSGLGLILATNLGITSDLPTFFRHSSSLRTSVLALTVIQLISIGLAICGLYIGSIISGNFEVNEAAVLGSGSEILRVALIIFVFLSVICANAANVYSASVGWEVVAPSALVGRKEYLILGLGLTTIFLLISNFFSMQLLLNASDYSLVNLCMILILGYIISHIREQAPDSFDQKAFFIGWLLATVVNTLQAYNVCLVQFSPLAVGFAAIVLVLVVSYSAKIVVKR